MAPRSKRSKCQICSENDSKYTCSGCAVVYCSVSCYKKHKDLSPSPPEEPPLSDENPPPLRPLTSLKWPYVPEESAYPDPLKRDDPKPLQTPQYEAIATSPAIRTALASHPNLPALLTSIDKLRGPDREDTLQRALGVTAPDIVTGQGGSDLSEDVLALRALAEAVEAAVRGGKEDVLGLNWGE